MHPNQLDSYLLSNFCDLITIQLDDTNYVTWRFMLESMLVGCDLLGYIDGSIPCPPQYKITKEAGITSELTQEYKDWRKHDSALMTLLAGTLSFDALSFIVGSKTSKEVWFILEERYAKLSKFIAFDLKLSMQQIQKGNDSIDKYMQRIKTVRDKLSVAGVYIPDEDIVTLILNGLPVDYATIKIVIRARETPISLSELRTMLLDVEFDITQESSSLTSSSPITAALGANTAKHTRTVAEHYHCGSYGTHPTTQVAHQAGYFNSIFGAYKSFNQRGRGNIRYQTSGRYYYRKHNNFGFVGNSCNSGEYDSFNGCTHAVTSSLNDVEGLNGSGLSNGCSNSLEVCQICNNKGHTAQVCSQRSFPRQIIASGSYMQCQICMKIGHSAAECLHRHNYNFQPTYVAPQDMTAPLSSQPLPVSKATHSLSLPVDNATPVPTALLTSRSPTSRAVAPTLEWQQAMVHAVEHLQTQGTWKLSSSPPDNIVMNCRQTCQPLELRRSLPVLPSG